MAATPDVRRVVVARSRPSAVPVQTASPSTPLGRSLSSVYGSPGSFRTDEENVLVFEFGARHMRAGFAGEPAPRCTVAYTLEQSNRAGDYRQYAPDFDQRVRKRKRGKEWDEGHVLWKADVSDVNLELVHDKLERLVRTAEQKYLMLDNRAKRVALAVSSMLPRPLLSTVLGTLFTSLQATSLTLLPSSVMVTIAAGLRSALVVDMGWEETFVHSVCEYREIGTRSSVRAGRMLSRGVRKMVNRKLRERLAPNQSGGVSFGEVDGIITRASWCRPHGSTQGDAGLSTKTMQIPLKQSNLPPYLDVTLEQLSQPVESTFFAFKDETPTDATLPDDHNSSIPQLMYKALLHLPPDLRQTCMSRVIFTGGCSRILGLKARILAELSDIIDRRGWSPIKNRGSVSQDVREDGAMDDKIRLPIMETPHEVEVTIENVPSQDKQQLPLDYPSDRLLASLTPDETTYLQRLRSTRLKQTQPTRQGPTSVRTIGTGMTLAPSPQASSNDDNKETPRPDSQRTSQPIKPAAWQPQEPDPILEKIKATARHERLASSSKLQPQSPREGVSPVRSPLSGGMGTGMGSIDAQAGMLSPPGEALQSSSLADGGDFVGRESQRCGLRAVNTLGAWQGASLLTNLRIKGVVEIEREKFLRDGFVG